VNPLGQVASPWLLTKIGPTRSGVDPGVVLHKLSQVLEVQTTGNGVTVNGGELKVPVAVNCTEPFLAVAGSGLMEMDSSTLGLEPPQLARAHETSEKTIAA